MKTTLVTPPTYYALTLDEAKDHLRITHSDEDPYIQALVFSAQAYAEQFLRRKLITQTWNVFLNNWPGGDVIALPFGQLQSVTHVKYTDTDGDQSTFSSADYIVDTDSDPGRIVLGYGETWPTATLYPSNPIEIQFVCGYGDHTPLSVTNATNASPIVLTTAAHGYTANDKVYVYGVGGNTAADGVWKITTPLATTIGLLGSSGNAAFTSGGTVIKQDVPMGIKNAIKLLISDGYENRDPNFIGQGFTLTQTKAVERLLWPHRLHGA